MTQLTGKTQGIKVSSHIKALPVVLCLDASNSMKARIPELNNSLQQFCSYVQNDDYLRQALDLAVLAFHGDHDVDCLRAFSPLFDRDGNPTGQSVSMTSVGGLTPMGEALEVALNICEDRKNAYKNSGQDYWEPVIILMTDGRPEPEYTAVKKVQEVVERMQHEMYQDGIQRFSFFPYAINDDAFRCLEKLFGSLPGVEVKKGNLGEDFFPYLNDSVKQAQEQQIEALAHNGQSALPVSQNQDEED